jgi:type III secretory pathway component EscS
LGGVLDHFLVYYFFNVDTVSICLIIQLPREVLVACLGPLISLLQAPSPVVHSYAALCIERLLTVKAGSVGGAQA